MEASEIKKGDVVFYVHKRDEHLIVCSLPWKMNDVMAVECKPEGKRENGFTHNLYDVKALVRVNA